MLEASSGNRITGLLDDPPTQPIPVVAVRTPAQREASRRNGALSRGPTTPEGKSRSSANAMKHGLLARRIIPPGDSRADDRMFSAARSSLLAQFKPQTFSDHCLIDALAHDYVLLYRARCMVESLYTPPQMHDIEALKYEELTETKHLVAAVDSLLQSDPFNANAADAKSIADILIDRAKQLQSEINDIQAEQTDGAPDERTEFELQEDKQRLRMWALIEPAFGRFTDAQYSMAVLSGQCKPARGDAKRLITLLKEIREYAKQRLIDLPKAKRIMRHREDMKRIEMAKDPGKVMLLEGYISRIERRIERKLEQLLR